VEPAWREAAVKRDGPSDFHLTVVEPQECTQEIEEQLVGLGVSEDELCILGFGAAPGCNFAVVHCSRLQHMRLRAGLELKNLHVTLGFAGKDRHDVNKSLHSLRTWSGDGEVLAACLENDGGALCEMLCKRSKRLLLRQRLQEVAHSAGRNIAYTLDQRTRFLELSLKSAYQCEMDSHSTDSLRAELGELDPAAALFLATKYAINAGILSGKEASEHVHAELRNLPAEMQFNERLSWLAEQAQQAALKEDAMWGQDNAGRLALIKIPLNCAPVVGTENKLWGSGSPSNTSLRAILQLGLARVVSLTEEPPSCRDEVADAKQLRFFHFPIRDRHAPESLKELLLICRCVQQGLAQARGQRGGVLVHCLGGKGRTVLVLAAVLMMEKNLSPSAALAQVKAKRNTCVTEEQVRALKQLYVATSVRAMRPLAHAAGSLPKSLPRVLVLCGLPGAGKSTFCLELIRQFPSSVRHINQDELGGKETESAWSAAAMSAARDGRIVAVLDKCNLKQAKRKSAYACLDPASRSKITLVYFSMGVDACADRAAARKDHIGEVTGEGARRIVQDEAQKCEAPVSASSEGVGSMHVVQDDDDALALLRSWGCAEAEEERHCVVCFPRTRHLKNLGAATGDDLHQEDASSFLMKTHEDDRIIVEEKVDGANLGLRLAEDGFSIVAQNRSHVVHSIYHGQFKKLDKWILDHSDVLRHVLRDHNLILYGEWVYALHSTSYDRLPGYFVAFDLRCVLTDTFVSRPELELMLRGTGIPQTPLLLSEPCAPGRQRAAALLTEILRLVDRKSSFALDTAAEGVYVRVQRGSWTVDRAKIVRPHFIPGNEHWSKGGVTVNELSLEAQAQTIASASATFADARAFAVPARVVA
jgi:predicted kinase